MTRKAVNEDVDAIADYAVKRMEFAEKVRQERKQEQRRLSRNRKLTFNQKVQCVTGQMAQRMILFRRRLRGMRGRQAVERISFRRKRELDAILDCTLVLTHNHSIETAWVHMQCHQFTDRKSVV